MYTLSFALQPASTNCKLDLVMAIAACAVVKALMSALLTQALLNERHGLLAWTSVNNPVIMHKLMTSKLVDPPIQDMETPGPDFWHRILVHSLLIYICHNGDINGLG